MTVIITPVDAERILSHVDTSAGPDACHPWTGTKTRAYGSTSVRGRAIPAHRALYCVAHGLPYEFDGVVRHVACGNPICCNVRHLDRGTVAQNCADTVRDGRSTRGERHPMHRITETQARAIKADPRSLREVSSEYGISAGQVSRIRKGESWSWL